ncbi:hypothetical protein SAY86_021858 [Trapa natans]|uniref:Ubiquitin-like protease family profile domain-containing protein n=1 Tax=Trapa natans TaxID=22666 RepID=A0AAN7MDB3_TRANT|nr:hypothetical protein SAY86_021858 [Trapa natans]
MGGHSSGRKRNDEFLNLDRRHLQISTPEFQSSKRLKFSSSTPELTVSSRTAVSRILRYPNAVPRLHREVHAPVRPHKFGSFTAVSQFRATPSTTRDFSAEEYSGSKMGNKLINHYEKVKRSALDSLKFFKVNQGDGMMLEDSTMEVDDDSRNADKVATNFQYSAISELSDGHVMEMDKVKELMVPMSLDGHDHDLVVLSKQGYQKLLEEVHRNEHKIEGLEFQIKFNQEKWSSLQLLCPSRKIEEEIPHEPFVPLTDEEEAEVRQALSGNRRNILICHEDSGIQITGEIMRCLRPTAWLNDEVINLYLALLKERERREPKKYLKCHFFNTFFYQKLLGKAGYDYKSVRRWTTWGKLGYNLIDCEKIFVPIHLKVHWCLAVINKKEEKFQYLDSLGGRNPNALNVLVVPTRVPLS